MAAIQHCYRHLVAMTDDLWSPGGATSQKAKGGQIISAFYKRQDRGTWYYLTLGDFFSGGNCKRYI